MFQDTGQLNISYPKYLKVPWKSWWFINTIFDKQLNLDAKYQTTFLIQVSLCDLLVHKWFRLTSEFLLWEKKKKLLWCQQMELLAPSKSHPRKPMSAFVVTIIKGYYLLWTLSFNVESSSQWRIIPCPTYTPEDEKHTHQLFKART